MSWAEDDWERLTPHVALVAEQAQRLVGDLGAVRGHRLLTGGKANSNHAVELDDGRIVVVRIYERDPDALEREARILKMVGGALPTAGLLARGDVDGTPAAVFEYVEGEHPSDVLAREGGRTAAEIGEAVAESLKPLLGFEYPRVGLFAPDLSYAREFDGVAHSFVDLVGWSLRDGRARHRLSPELRAALAARLDDAARLLEPLDETVCLTHCDYKFSNILVRQERDWSVTAVLDWEFAGPFTPLLDVAILMRHRETFPAEFVDAFEAVYATGGALPEDWRWLTRVLDLMNLVGFLNASGERPRLFAAVIDRIERTVERLG